MEQKTPKTFISYSWSSPGHCDQIRSYAERLMSDGVDILLDQWDLSEGQDKYTFMEKMVTDQDVSHVIIFSDQVYAQKADKRKAGVGAESQIISKEVYEKVDQKNFIPVVCQRQENNEPCLPTFLSSRIWIDFSTPESVQENWEKLLRALYNKPIHEKPGIGKPPSYLVSEEGRPALPTIGKYNSLRNAILESKPTVQFCRNDFLEAALGYADALRIRERPNLENFDEKVLSDLHTLLPLRDQLIDWLLLETEVQKASDLEKTLIDFLERILSLKYKPSELTSGHDAWFDAHGIFVYEMFLYLIAALIKTDHFSLIREVLTTNYLLPDSETERNRGFVTFDEFWVHSEILDQNNKRLKRNRRSPIADLIKKRSTRRDICFQGVMQAELIILLFTLISENVRWCPHTLIYSRQNRARFPLFIRAAQHKHFDKLKTITGIATGDELRNRFKQGYERHGVDRWSDFVFHAMVSFWDCMNMDALDTIK